MSSPAIISFGEVLWDLFPDGERFGGAPANFACHSAILGAEVSMASAVGNDQRGEKAVAILSGYGIDVSLINVVDDLATGAVGITLDSAGKPQYEIHEGVAWDRIPWTEGLAAQVAKSDAMYFGTLGQRSKVSRDTIRLAIETARKAKVARVLDVNLRAPYFTNDLIRESVENASILKLSDEELPEVCSACRIQSDATLDAVLQRLLETMQLDVVVVTRGAEGATLATQAGVVTQPGIPTTVRDTVGAGDSFTAAFLVGLLRNDPHEKILRKACEIASEVCGHSGAVPRLS